MNEHVDVYSIDKGQDEYTVTFGYHKENQEAESMFGDDTKSWHVCVEVLSTDILSAIQLANKVLNAERALILTGFVDSAPEQKDTYTKEEIDKLRMFHIEKGIFHSWMRMEPTSVQAALSVDHEMLKSNTVDSVLKHTEDIGNQAEEFLKEQED